MICSVTVVPHPCKLVPIHHVPHSQSSAVLFANCAASKPRTEAGGKDAVHGGAFRRHTQSPADVALPDHF